MSPQCSGWSGRRGRAWKTSRWRSTTAPVHHRPSPPAPWTLAQARRACSSLSPQLGFIFMNALAFWFEVAGSTLGFVLGRPLPLFVFEVLYAFAVGYVLYWLVIHAEGRDYKFAAICLYVIYSLINIVQAVGALVLILPAVFFFLKTLASLSCALYAFKLRELGADPYSRMEEEVDLSVPAE